MNFAKTRTKLVLKDRLGDSGKQVCLYKLDSKKALNDLIPYMKKNGFDLIEEVLLNHEDLNKFNETSLNTIRIVTVNVNGRPEILIAVLRVGAKGSFVDNMCQGGSCARINLDTGKLDSPFRAFKTKRCDDIANDDNIVAYSIPIWNEVKQMVTVAADMVPQIGIVSWDVAVTPEGPALIEGNESFDTKVLQLYTSETEDGLKPRLLSLLNEKTKVG